MPFESVTAFPLVPALGPEVTWKCTVAPRIGLPLSFCTVAVKVCGCPTLLVAEVGDRTTPLPTTAALARVSKAAKKMLSSFDGLVVVKVRSVSPFLTNGSRL